MNTKTAYLGIGTNLGDKVANVHKAIEMVDAHEGCTVSAVSSIYITKPVGVKDQPDFANAVIAVKTALDPYELLELCNKIEREMGRKRTIRWGPRVIDMDILLYEDVNISEKQLTIPHPMMMERAFVLIPLAEIAPDLELPGGITAKEAAEQIDRAGIKQIHLLN
ncbi:2-amino-4-hydroxy-6-hydroxymethyldihydropteridine diphosphokinase [bacterium]|nr:2-amino-4-hydroxy-6-hydroxymethyldihydropteridine diphosphokinase [bacterium]